MKKPKLKILIVGYAFDSLINLENFRNIQNKIKKKITFYTVNG